jgi:hypothetical protein
MKRSKAVPSSLIPRRESGKAPPDTKPLTLMPERTVANMAIRRTDQKHIRLQARTHACCMHAPPSKFDALPPDNEKKMVGLSYCS